MSITKKICLFYQTFVNQRPSERTRGKCKDDKYDGCL